MKQFKSHKIVEAAKIVSVSSAAPTQQDPLGQDVELVVDNGQTVETIKPHGDWHERALKMARGCDLHGGYYVKYPDGFDSWSPASAFEEGYTELQPPFAVGQHAMRAKLQVSGISKHEDASGKLTQVTVGMFPVSGKFGPNGESEDNTFARYSPSGRFELTITNPALIERFRYGQKFYADFVLAAD